MDPHRLDFIEHAIAREPAGVQAPEMTRPTLSPGVAPAGFTLVTWEMLELPLDADDRVELLQDAFVSLEAEGSAYDQGVCVREEDASRIVRFACELHEQAAEEPQKELEAA